MNEIFKSLLMPYKVIRMMKKETASDHREHTYALENPFFLKKRSLLISNSIILNKMMNISQNSFYNLAINNEQEKRSTTLILSDALQAKDSTVANPFLLRNPPRQTDECAKIRRSTDLEHEENVLLCVMGNFFSECLGALEMETKHCGRLPSFFRLEIQLIFICRESMHSEKYLEGLGQFLSI